VAKLVADPERLAEWKHGKALTQKQLAGLLKPFGIISETVHPIGQSHARATTVLGLKRSGSYLPGQMPAQQIHPSEACKRANTDWL